MEEASIAMIMFCCFVPLIRKSSGDPCNKYTSKHIDQLLLCQGMVGALPLQADTPTGVLEVSAWMNTCCVFFIFALFLPLLHFVMALL